MLTVAQARQRLAFTYESVNALVMAGDDAQNSWKPDEQTWSVHEILCHLLSEESVDFRQRLDLTLHHPTQEWPMNDPDSTVGAIKSRYTTEDALAEFGRERQRSLAWLAELGEPDLTIAHHHEEFGSKTAGTLLISWVAHDVLHVRQIADRHWQYLTHVAPPHSTDYAR